MRADFWDPVDVEIAPSTLMPREAQLAWKDTRDERSAVKADEVLHLSVYGEVAGQGEYLIARFPVPANRLPHRGRRDHCVAWWGPKDLEFVYRVPAGAAPVTFTRLSCSAPNVMRLLGLADDKEIPATFPVTIEPGCSLTLDFTRPLLSLA